MLWGAAPLFSRRERMSKESEKMERKSYRCLPSETKAAQKEAKRRGMTLSQLVRLAVAAETKRGGK